MMRWDVINTILGWNGGSRYLEIGIQFGHCGAKVRAAEKIGVDPEPKGKSRAVFGRVFAVPSDAYFASLDASERFDCILVDGLHHADQVLRDVENALCHLTPSGIVVMHDCSPREEIHQIVPRQSGVWNGDAWRAMVALRQRPDIDAVTLDDDYGIGLVRRRPNPARLEGLPENLSWNDLECNRRELLGLRPASELAKWLTAS